MQIAFSHKSHKYECDTAPLVPFRAFDRKQRCTEWICEECQRSGRRVEISRTYVQGFLFIHSAEANYQYHSKNKTKHDNREYNRSWVGHLEHVNFHFWFSIFCSFVAEKMRWVPLYHNGFYFLTQIGKIQWTCYFEVTLTAPQGILWVVCK